MARNFIFSPIFAEKFFMKKVFVGLTISFLLLIVIFACKKKYDAPPYHDIPNTNQITVAQLKTMYTGTNITFTTDVNLYCTVIADETSGNFYKESYVRDATGAIHLKLMASGGLYVGDSLRINLNGSTLMQYQGVLQLDSIDVNKMVVKQKSGLNPQPITLNISQINDNYLGQLIKFNNVEFLPANRNQYFADYVNQNSSNWTIRDCSNNQILVRTSGYANFASQKTPSGNGSIIAIVGKYSGTYQIYIRNYNEVQMAGANCGATPSSTLNEAFSTATPSANINLIGWVNTNSNNTTTYWTADNSAYTGNTTARATLFGATAGTADTLWLISPLLQATGATQNLSFNLGIKYYKTGHPNLLSVMISTNYTSGSPATATWTTIPGFTIPAGNTTGLQTAGTVNLTSILPPSYTGTFRIAFKHYGLKGTYDSNVYIDNILIP